MIDTQTEFRPDFRKSLKVLKAEWQGCTRCELGERREKVHGEFVFGEGDTDGILFVGEGPGREEEKGGRPFIGKSGNFFRKVLKRLDFVNYYITNIVCCRSCVHEKDPDGMPIYRTPPNGGPSYPLIKDIHPTKDHVTACSTRLYEQIYLVDPVIIVALGAPAASALIGTSIAIGKERGELREITIPGVAHNPVRTDKKQEWVRKKQGEILIPTAQNKVRYLMLATWHPAYVIRKITVEGKDSPFQQFADDLQTVMKLYSRYMLEVHKVLPQELSTEVLRDLKEHIMYEEEDWYEED